MEINWIKTNKIKRLLSLKRIIFILKIKVESLKFVYHYASIQFACNLQSSAKYDKNFFEKDIGIDEHCIKYCIVKF